MSDGDKNLRSSILQAAARGYCIAENSHKELDSTLLEAVVDEVMMVLSARPSFVIMECAFVIMVTNYWKNKSGYKIVEGAGASLEDAIAYCDNLHADREDYVKAKWVRGDFVADKNVDYDGATVKYHIEPFKLAGAQPSLVAPGVAEALREAIAAGVRQPNEQFAYHRCNHCDCTWWGDVPGRSNPERPVHRAECPITKWQAALSAQPSAIDARQVVGANLMQALREQHAEEAGQIIRRVGGDTTELFSENLY